MFHLPVGMYVLCVLSFAFFAASRYMLGLQVGFKEGEEIHWTKCYSRGKIKNDNLTTG